MAMTAEAKTAMKEIRLVLVSMADGKTEGVPIGWYLASYNPEARAETAKHASSTMHGS